VRRRRAAVTRGDARPLRGVPPPA